MNRGDGTSRGLDFCPRCGRYPAVKWDARRGCWVAECRRVLRHVRAESDTALGLIPAWNAAVAAGKRRRG